MSALTYEVKDLRSPVAVWMRSRFPHHGEIQKQFREAAGAQLVAPGRAVAHATQGAAIDWWIRFLVDPAPTLHLAATGITWGRRKFGSLPCFDVGDQLINELGGVDSDRTLRAIDPAQITDRDDEWQARVCYALALLVEPLRAYTIDGSRLMLLDRRSSTSDLLALANDEEVADLGALRDLARNRLLPALPAGQVVTGCTFEGSRDLNADADLISAGMLVDIKAGQGGKPRKDGTRVAKLARDEIDQLIGYTLLDYNDAYAIRTVAIYAARFGCLVQWPVNDLLARLAGRPAGSDLSAGPAADDLDLAPLRQEFRQIVQVDLPAYWKSNGMR